MEQANASFDEHIPGIYYQNIQQTFINHKVHIKEIKVLYNFYQIISRSHPIVYVSKSKVRINNDAGYCPMPGVNGTVENAARLFEKQFFDVLYLLLGGAYRPSMVILRYMLEQSTWVAASIISKKFLTKRPNDRNKAMSHFEFKHFLYDNMLRFQTNQTIKSKQKTVSGLQKIPYEYIQHMKTQNRKIGFEALNYFYTELSKYAHANIWFDLEINEEQPTHVERTNMYIGKPSPHGYHRALNLVIESHKLIFYLLLISAYENIGYYNPCMAKEFFTEVQTKINRMQTIIEFSSIEKLLQNPPSIEHSFLKSSDNYDENEEEEEEYEVCSDCGSECGCDEKCIVCDHQKYFVEDYNNQYTL